ncbi:hypothetical protein [Gemmatimonas sp.]|uniref:hypothetical protein n=1 Tax=Gemmatimonas sp. TaxID=1962908 RepID=UPI003DA3808C
MIRSACVSLSIVILATSRLGNAQGGFSERATGFGTRISLPVTWQLASDAELTSNREAALARMRSGSVQQLREMAASNENAPLFRAKDPATPSNSANMNVTISPQTTSAMFSEMTARDVGELVGELCRSFREQTQQTGGTGECLRHELVTLEGRRAVVIHQTFAIARAGLDNRRTVVLVPAPGLLFTLSISMRRTGFDAALPRAIMASLKFPADLK